MRIFYMRIFIGCRIAYKKGLDDGRESSCWKQPLRDIDKKKKNEYQIEK